MTFKNGFLTLVAGAIPFAFIATASAQNISWERDWFVTPDDAGYLTDDHNQRTVAYNPETGNLLVVNRAGGLQIHVLDSDSGAEIGQMSVAGVSGGTFDLNKIRVADDGVIYAANLTVDTDDNDLRIYRWEDEEDDEPTVIFSGDPADGKNDPDEYHNWSRRWGDVMDVRGEGASTEILLASRNENFVAVFTTDDGETFTLYPLVTDLPGEDNSGRFYNGIAFGEGNRFWGSAVGRDLEHMEYDLDEETATSIGNYGSDVFPHAIGPLNVDVDNGYLAGIRTDNHEMFLYDLTTLSEGTLNIPLATYQQTTDNDNGNATGGAAFGADDRVYLLETNNELVAFTIGPVQPGEIFWATADAIRTAERDGSNPRGLVAGLERPIGVFIDDENEHIYWAEDGAGRIARSDLDGTNVSTVIDGRSNPQYVALHDGRIFWSEWLGGLYSSDLEGNDVQHLIQEWVENTSALAIDEEADDVYLAAVGSGELFRINTDGSGNVETVDTLSDNIYGMAIDGVAGVLYNTVFTADLVQSYDLDTGSVDDLFTDRELPLGITLSSDRSQLFWAERTNNEEPEGRIFSASADGTGDAQTLVEGENSPFGIAVLPFEPAPDFDNWIAQFDLPAEQDGPGDDPDGDGVENLLEYALAGGDPTTPRSAQLPVIGAEDDMLTLTVHRNPDAVGITYQVEVSSDLDEWQSEGHVTITTDEPGLLVVRDNTATGDADRRFIRLKVIAE